MRRLVIRSRREDIKGFMNLVSHRVEKINEAEYKPVVNKYGVNILADKLHPKTQELVITDIYALSDKIKIISLVPAEGKPAFFRAGQSLNIRQGSFSAPFPILSAPGTEKYEIAVFSDSDNSVSEYLYELSAGSAVSASGPEGLFYYTSLRDRKEVVAVCDSEGIVPIISMARSGEFGLKIIYCDKLGSFDFRELLKEYDVEYISEFSADACSLSDCSVFVSGRADFCEGVTKTLKLEKGRVRTHIVFPAQTAALPDAEYKCKVIYRDRQFEFTCRGNETVLAAFERNGVPSASKCKVGECGFWRSSMIEGKVNTVRIAGVDSLREADKKYNFIHPCRAFAESDITLAL